MQSKNATAIVHVMVGMCGIHKLYVRYLEHKPPVLNRTSSVNTWRQWEGPLNVMFELASLVV